MSAQRVGSYRLLEVIGRGGMGTVHRAIDAAGRSVALKLLDGAALTPAGIERFLREARVRIEHPNVVRTLGAGSDSSGRPYVVLELLEGRALDAEISIGLSVADVLDVGLQAAHGLSAIHAAGLIHRDVKPANLFRCQDGTIRVLDFGIAAATERAGALTVTGAIVGTPAYLSPEQARGDRQIDARADIFSLGVVLYEALTGESPFERTGTLATLLAVAMAPALPPRMRNPRVPSALEAIVLRALEKDPARRFESAAALAEALGRVDPQAPPEPVRISSAPSGEQRSVALVLARGLSDEARFAAIMSGHGGEAVPLLSRGAVGVFGGQRSHGDEIDRALAAARAAEGTAARLALAAGQASLRGELLDGEALREADEACDRVEEGLVTGTVTGRALASRSALVEIEPGLFSIGGALGDVLATPLLGREAELATLTRARDIVLAERRPLASWIVGPAGIGKSRLADAVQALAAQGSMRHRAARAVAHDVRSLSLFARALGSGGRAHWRTPSRGIEAQTLSDLARNEVVTRLEHLLGEGPLVLALDDLQWADEESLRLLEELPVVMEGRPLWLVLVARDELFEARPELLGAFDSAARIEPSPLRAADVVQIARARTGIEPVASVAQALADRTGGNPLFIEQLLDVVDRRALESDEISEWPLPPTIEHAVQARLDALPPEEKECAKELAVYGRPATSSEIEALGLAGALTLLSSLVRRSLASRALIEAERVYRFRSPLVGEVAYRLVDPERRAVLHRIAAEVALAHGRGAEAVARHLEEAGDGGRAAQLYAQAALEAARAGDGRGVLRCAAHAVDCGLPAQDAFEIHFARAEAARFVGDPELQEQTLADAARTAKDDRERALAACERGELLRRTRRLDDALAELSRAVALAAKSGDTETSGRALARQASTLITLGRLGEADAVLAAVDGVALSPGTRAIVEDARGYLAATTGDHGARRAAYVRAARLYAEAGDLRRSAGAESNGADAFNRLGRFDDAQESLQRALQLARKLGNRLTEGYALANLGYSLCASGHPAAALGALRDAKRIAAAMGERHLALAVRLYTLRARFETEVDRTLAREIETLASEAAGDPTLEASARALLARAWISLADPAAACREATRALVLRDGQGAMEEGEGEIFLAAAMALEAAGKTDEARAVRERGRARVQEMASRIADPEERQAFLERVPAHRAL